MFKIIMADDHAVVCTGLRLILNQSFDLRIVEQVSNGGMLLEKLKSENYDLVILDISMPGKDALDTLKEIKQCYPKLPVVIFTMNPDESFSARMLSNGASAYVSKETDPELLPGIFRKAIVEGRHISPAQQELLEHYNTTSNIKNKKEHELLTDREYQVLHLLVSGVKKDDIARSLLVSKNTVSNHRNNILKKLNISSNSELTRYALQHGLIN